MICPNCGKPTFVQMTRSTPDKVYRARKCTDKVGCNWNLSTVEMPCPDEEQHKIFALDHEKRKGKPRKPPTLGTT